MQPSWTAILVNIAHSQKFNKPGHAAIVTYSPWLDPSAREVWSCVSLVSFWLRTLSWIDYRPIVANDGAGCQACQIDMRFCENVHHLLACGQKVVGDDPAVAAPPDRFGAHDHAPLFRAAFPEPRQAGSERRRQSVVCVVTKAAYSPIGIGRGFRVAWLSAAAPELADMLVTDLKRGQHFRECFLIELRVGP